MPAFYNSDTMMNNHNNEVVPAVLVSSLTTKIAEGAELTSEDLRSADELLKQQRNNDHHGSNHDDDDVSFYVPQLDRKFLHSWNSNQPQLIRYTGMVQNMLEPEYYVSTFDGKSTHFRDVPVVTGNDGMEQEIDLSSNLAERVPHMIVPIPFISDWMASSVSKSKFSATSTTATSPVAAFATEAIKIPESPPQQQEEAMNNKKRDREDNNFEDSSKSDTSSSKPRTENGNDLNSMDCCDGDDEDDNAVLQGQELDWWPQGCMGSAKDQCPVLAKLYYDLTQDLCGNSKRKLRLNDMVEFVGILSMDPWEADFASLQQNDNDAVFFSFGTTPPPPPSRLPRVHVLSYKIVDMDTFGRSHCISQHQLKQQHEEVVMDYGEQPSIIMESPPTTPSTAPLKDIATSVFKDPVLAEAICMTLLSKAQRESAGSMQRVSALQHAVGCLSLQISANHDTSKQVYQQLSMTLQEICPNLATVDLSKQRKNDGTLFPASFNGRLGPTPWQLPRGSTLLIHWGNDTCLSSPQDKECLYDLVRQHRMSYTFDGGMQVPFDADYRIIVVTSNRNNDTRLPCSIKMELSEDLELPSIMDDEQHQLLSQFRMSLAEARFWGNNIGFFSSPQEVLKKAEQYFLDARAKARTNNTVPPQEEDFHRWLTLTRLQARSQARGKFGCASANMQDWERAVSLEVAVTSTNAGA